MMAVAMSRTSELFNLAADEIVFVDGRLLRLFLHSNPLYAATIFLDGEGDGDKIRKCNPGGRIVFAVNGLWTKVD